MAEIIFDCKFGVSFGIDCSKVGRVECLSRCPANFAEPDRSTHKGITMNKLSAAPAKKAKHAVKKAEAAPVAAPAAR